MQWETMYKDITTQRRNCVKTINAGRSIPYPSLLIPDPQKKKNKQKERWSNSEHFQKKTETLTALLFDICS